METTKKISVPDGWHDVTISQYQEIATLESDHPSIRMIETISILIDEDPEIVRTMNLNSLNKIIEVLAWTNKTPDDAVYKPIITIDEKEYGFISRISDLTTGEWIDL